MLQATEAVLVASGKFDEVNFTPQGLAGIFALYAPAGSNLGQVFLNEFVCVRRPAFLLFSYLGHGLTLSQTFIIATVLWAVLDPTNFFVTPVAAPIFVALSL